jgi:ribosomal protein S18 acetylase RimI-like enzyme
MIKLSKARKTMLQIIQVRKAIGMPSGITQTQIVSFLHTHLGQFRDEETAISKSIDYAFSSESGKGGFLLLALDDNQLAGVLIMNQTGMNEFVPENLLVYIAVDSTLRGRGIGASIIRKAFEVTEGNIALHVEYDNPAKRLYERLGFSSKYAEMRWNRKA